ncbi:MAG: transposase [Verrucomicrobia bacterium]|nr:transposase [Verrucomicrobiota bacterium]
MKTSSAVGPRQADAEQSEESWRQRELVGCHFKDERLSKRFSMVLKQIAEGTAESIPLACQDWANTKAAYRFFANERVSEADILAPRCADVDQRSRTHRRHA